MEIEIIDSEELLFEEHFQKNLKKGQDSSKFVCPVSFHCDHGTNQKIKSIFPPTHLIFGTVIDIVSIFYHTKNQVVGYV